MACDGGFILEEFGGAYIFFARLTLYHKSASQ